MILESAYLQVKAGETASFEVAFREAPSIIASMQGYMFHELHKCLESENLYLQLVKW